MITEYLQKCQNLTYTEEILRDYILEHPQAILNLSIKELSHECHIGMASVNRLCSKLGFSGYSDFKVAYIKDYKDVERLREVDKLVPFTTQSTIHDVIEQLPYIYEKAIGYTKIAIDQGVMQRCVNVMQNSFIMIFGVGMNKSIAEMFSYKLEELGLQSKAYDSIHYQFLGSLMQRKTASFAILLSHTGKNPSIMDAAMKLHKHKIPTLLICNSASEELRMYCSDILYIIPTMNTKELSNVQFSIATQYVLDVFYALLLIKNMGHVENIETQTGFKKIGEQDEKSFKK